MSPRLVALVLPPREGFGPGRTGAVGMIAHRLALATSDVNGVALAPIVIGGPQAGPLFGDVRFQAARPSRWLPANPNRRYAASVAGKLRRLHPALIEVHNRTEIALHLARGLPSVPVSLFLHNDPQGMGGLKSIAERASVIGRLARVVVVSDFLRRQMLDGLPRPLPGPEPF